MLEQSARRRLEQAGSQRLAMLSCLWERIDAERREEIDQQRDHTQVSFLMSDVTY